MGNSSVSVKTTTKRAKTKYPYLLERRATPGPAGDRGCATLHEASQGMEYLAKKKRIIRRRRVNSEKIIGFTIES